jgi:CPA2 family monovalent cation:H+ antiporter-2
VVDSLQRAAPQVPVFIRTRYLAERDGLLEQGATDVVTEEVEAGIEMTARLLSQLEVPRNRIEQQVREARAALQTSARKVTVPRKVLPEHAGLADLKIDSLQVTSDSAAEGRSLAELQIRHQTRATIVAIRRAGRLLDHPDPHTRLEVDDVVYLVGSGDAIRAACDLLANGACRE